VPTREEVTLNQVSAIPIGAIGSPNLGVGGWSVEAHHVYDPQSRTLYLGTGKQVSADVVSTSTERFAGTGAFGSSGDGGPARNATMGPPRGVLAGPDGSIYIVDRANTRIRRVGPDGIISRFAGGGSVLPSSTPIAATEARLFSPVAVALDADGNLYIADQSNFQVYRVTTDGQLTVFAGTGENGSGAAGDGGPATEARFSEPFALAVGPDGSVYIADVLDLRIRRVGPDGIISTFAGNGEHAVSGDGGPATAAGLAHVVGLSFDGRGNLYLSNYTDGVFNGVRRVGTDGIIRAVAGGGTAQPADGMQATDAVFSHPFGLWTTADGTSYFGDQLTHVIWRVGTDGVLSRAAGTRTACFPSAGNSFCGDGGPATAAGINQPVGTAIDPAGRLLVAELGSNVVRRFRPTMPGFTGAGLLLAAGDPGELYEFDPSGRHLRTINGFTGATRYSFAYDAAGRLTGITDGDGGTTTIERATNGNPIAIVGPDAHRTTLAVTPEGFLQRIEDPEGHAWTAAYGSGGLVTGITNPNNHASEYSYGALGRLTRTLDAEGGTKTPVRTDESSGHSVGITSGLGVARSYRYEPLPGGASRRVATSGAGLVTTTVSSSNGSDTTITPDGTRITTRQGPDPRLGMQAGVEQSRSIRLPSGLTATITSGRRTVPPNPADPLSVTSQTDSTIVNGRVFRSTWTTQDRTITSRSPVGRTATRRLDAQGRVVEVSVPGLTPMTFDYDGRGRLLQIEQGARASAFTYNAAGRIATYTDAANRETQFLYDGADRLIRTTRPGNRTTAFGYDATGNATTITPPGRPAHQVGFNRVNLATSYVPPDVGGGTSATSNTFDADRRPTRIVRPDGAELTIAYDPAGRPLTMTTPQGEARASYNATTGQVTGLTSPGGVTLGFTYDGPLPTQATWSGPVAGSVAVTYNNNAQAATQRVNGGNAINFTYDNDGLLTNAGSLSLTRNPANGLVTGTTLSPVTTTRQYNGFAELAALGAARGATSLFSSSYTRDQLGRLLEAVETVEGTTVTLGYTYDAAGRLSEVRRNGVVTAVYGYDDNGNRTSVTGPGISATATYDDQDRLLTYGSNTYTYTAAGELRTQTDASGTTTYGYDVLGNLTTVSKPDGAQIEYLVDGHNRRVGKRVGGVLERGWIYAGSFTPVAELNGSGQLVSRFVYGAGAYVPDYMIRAGVTYRIITDHLGSVRLVVNVGAGTVVQRIDYDEFGRVLANTNPDFQPFGYAGGLYDSQTGLVRFGARDYDAASGRWTAKDPILFKGGDPNLYAYVGNDPINFADPQGKLPILAVGAINGLIQGGFDAFDNAFGTCDPSAGSILGAFAGGFIEGAVEGIATSLFGLNPFLLGALSGTLTALAHEEELDLLGVGFLVIQNTLIGGVNTGRSDVAEEVIGGVLGGTFNLVPTTAGRQRQEQLAQCQGPPCNTAN
jgi:RHS repeat-associated protein